ncbi:MAG: hypothetical protein JNK04_00895 [Myxococcales bacterium]|nr:hypothetical protein [Myxococcales bacterium]
MLLSEIPVELAKAAAVEEPAETLAGRASVLGDVGPSRVAKWCFSDGAAAADGLSQLDAVIMVFGPTAETVGERVDALANLLHRHGATIRVERARALDGDREHFGYVDGISQPAFEGIRGPVEAYGTVSSDGTWRPLRPGALVLGYADEE